MYFTECGHILHILKLYYWKKIASFLITLIFLNPDGQYILNMEYTVMEISC